MHINQDKIIIKKFFKIWKSLLSLASFILEILNLDEIIEIYVQNLQHKKNFNVPIRLSVITV